MTEIKQLLIELASKLDNSAGGSPYLSRSEDELKSLIVRRVDELLNVEVELNQLKRSLKKKK